jgi:hypothetical protein
VNFGNKLPAFPCYKSTFAAVNQQLAALAFYLKFHGLQSTGKSNSAASLMKNLDSCIPTFAA